MPLTLSLFLLLSIRNNLVAGNEGDRKGRPYVRWIRCNDCKGRPRYCERNKPRSA